MKRFSLFGSLLLGAALLFTITSCEDTPGGFGSSAPILTLEAGGTTDDVTVDPGTVLTFVVSGLSSGDSEMNNLRFLEDGAQVADFATRITIDGTAASSANVLLFNDDRTSFTKTITWTAHTDESARTYALEVTDADGNTDSEAIVVTTENSIVFPGLAMNIVDDGTGNCLIENTTNFTPGAEFCVNLEGSRGTDFELVSLLVTEGGTQMTDLTRLKYNGVEFDANPLMLSAADVNGFISSVSVVAHNTQGEAKDYGFIITDGNGDQASRVLNVSTTLPPSDIQTQIGVLFNAAGPAGTGGLDLSTQTGTGSTDAAADIADQGIDSALPAASNWKQKFGPVNGATLKLAPSSAEFPTSFADIAYKSEISSAFALGTTVSETPIVNIGDLFLVQDSDGTIFYLECTNVDITTESAPPMANNDSYTFDIKY